MSVTCDKLVARLDKYFSYQERVYVRNVACRTITR